MNVLARDVTAETFLDGAVTLHAGDCLAVLPTLDENSVDSVVCDPPYHLTSIVNRFGSENAAPAKVGKTGAYARASAGFMGKKWDGGDIAFQAETWCQVLRVLKPGGHLLAFGGTRTFGRMHVAIEDAGFEIRDMISWLYGSGFPKSLDVSKAIDKAAGAEREVVGVKRNNKGDSGAQTYAALGEFRQSRFSEVTSPTTDEARAWSGFGTALKPACEPIVLARKPLSESTVAANVLKWGTGALNIDGCRVDGGERPLTLSPPKNGKYPGEFRQGGVDGGATTQGRWPANVIHDGSDEVVGAFPETGAGAFPSSRGPGGIGNDGHKGRGDLIAVQTDSGSAARFFYTAKADVDDRLGSKHPTVKPLDLMQYLVRLVTPPKGLVLDPFAGTGTTGEAAIREGMRAILIEREPEYQNDIRRRMLLVMSGPDERRREAIKEKTKDQPIDAGPLFGGSDIKRGGAARQTNGLIGCLPNKATGQNDWPDRAQVVTK